MLIWRKQQRMPRWGLFGILVLLLVSCGIPGETTQTDPPQLTSPRPRSTQVEPTEAVPTPTAPTQIERGDWPTYLMDNGHSGFNKEENIITRETASSLEQHWTYHARGAISTQPMIAFGKIFWGSWDGLEHATDMYGHEVWSTNLGKTQTCGFTIGVASTATATSIEIKGAITPVILVGGGNATFYALNANTGSVIWKTPLGVPLNNFIYSSPVIYQQSVYIGMASFGDCPAVQGKLFQMNLATVAIQHTFNVVPDGCIGGGIWSSPTIDDDSGELYLSTGSLDKCWTEEVYVTSLVELQASDLKYVGSWQVPRSEWVIDSDFGASPTLFEATIGGATRSLVGVAHKNGTYYAFTRGAIGNGPAWRAHVAQGGSCPSCGFGSMAPSAWDSTRLYVAGGSTTIKGTSCKGSLLALHPATGAVLWAKCLSSGPVLGAVTAIPGVVAVASGSVVELVEATSGETLFTFHDPESGSNFEGAPSISKGSLFIGNAKGTLYSFGLGMSEE